MNADNISEDCFGYVLGTGETLAYFIISCKSNKALSVQQFMPIENFVENIDVVFDQKFKAIILNVFDITAETGFPNNVEFCEAIRAKLNQLKILHYFISDHHFTIATSLIVGNITAKLQESVFIIMASDAHYSIFELCFTKDGYKLNSHRFVHVDSRNESLENIQQKIYCSTPPDKIIIGSLDPNCVLYLRLKTNASKFKNLIAVDVSDVFQTPVLLVEEMYKWLMDKNIFELCFTKDGYKLNSHRFVHVDSQNESLEDIQQKIYGSTPPDKIIVGSLDPNCALFLRLKTNASKFKNLIAVDVSDVFQTPVLLVEEMYKWLMDKKYIKYHVIPPCARTYYISNKSVEDADRLRYVSKFEALPFKESFQLSRNVQTAFFTYIGPDTKKPKLLQKFSLSSNCHLYCVTVSVDAEHFPTIKIEPNIQPQIQMLPQMLDITCKEKVPVILFFYNISFICIPTKTETQLYEFLDEWNGAFGKDLYISFDEENPKYCEDALEVYKSNPSFVVYDLVKIILMSPNNIDTNSDWKFTFTKDSENPVLLEFDTFDGTKKAASPQFLLAMLIKQHVKAITAKTAEKPK
uniref:Uncharacterized protein n=1 Tax=Panagrolaimus sp. ES5 TaxID=591445 RepID=A0AC34FNU5_9BILA